MDTLERLLLELSDVNSGFDPGNIIDNIEAIAFGDNSDVERELFLNLLLTSEQPPSLISYVNSNIRSKDKVIVKAKISALKLAYRYMKLIGAYFDRFALSSYMALLDIYRREDSGEVRAAVLLPIKILFKFCQKFGYSESLGLPEVVASRLEKFSPENISLSSLYRYLIDDIKFNKKSMTKSAKSELFKIFGLLVNAYPLDDSTNIQVPIIVEHCLWNLEQYFGPSSKDIEPSIIAGIFSCLDRICYSFDQVAFASQKSRSFCFECLLKAISAATHGDISRFAMSSKALRLMKNHSHLFQQLIGDNARQTYDIIFDCYASGKEGISKHAVDALLAIVARIADSVCALVENRKSLLEILGSEVGRAYVILVTNFLKYINKVADVDKSIAAETSYIARAISALSPAIARMQCIGYLNPEFGDVVVNIVKSKPALLKSDILNYESQYFGDIPVSWSTKYVHLFFAVSALVMYQIDADSVPQEVIQWLLETSTESIYGYCRLTKKYQQIVNRGLIQFSIGAEKKFMNEYTLQFVRPLFLRSASRGRHEQQSNEFSLSQLSLTDEGNSESFLDNNIALQPLATEYAQLWNQLIYPTDKGVNLLLAQLGLNYHSRIGVTLLNQFYVNLVDTLRVLNLDYSTNEERNQVLPSNPTDQDLIINLASLVDNVAPSAYYDITIQWLPIIVPLLIEKISRFPLVSALYRILDSIFIVMSLFCDLYRPECSYGLDAPPSDFDGYLSSYYSSIDQDVAEAHNFFMKSKDLTGIVDRIRAFLLHVKSNMSAYSEELLFSVVGLLLHTPKVVYDQFDFHVGSILVALETGYQVQVALPLLESYVVAPLSKCLQLHLQKLLVLLEEYIVLPDDDSKRKKGAAFYTKQAIRLRFMASSNSLVDIQRSVLRILGRLGGLNQYILPAQKELLESTLAWAPDSQLVTLKLPFLGLSTSSYSGSMKLFSQRLTQATTAVGTQQHTEYVDVRVCIDRLLPRIVELATSQTASTDRNAKLAAAESLHGIILYLIGMSATSPEQNRTSFNDHLLKLYSKLLPVVVTLSVDSEDICCRLFDKLLFQIVHWFSRGSTNGQQVGQSQGLEAIALVDCLMDLLCKSIDARVRLQCIKSLSEFFKWSMKQFRSNSSGSGVNELIDLLLSKLFVAASHSNAAYRHGAISVFNQIYVYFREDIQLVGRYGLQILSVLLKSTQLGCSDAEFKDLEDALQKFGSILLKSISSREDQARLLETSETRIGPMNLRELVDWVWTHTSYTGSRLRKICMQLFVMLSPLLHPACVVERAFGVSTSCCNLYIQNFLSVHGMQGLLALAIGSFAMTTTSPLLDISSALLQPSISDLQKKVFFDEPCLSQMSAALDFLCWLIKNKIIEPTAVYCQGEIDVRDKDVSRDILRASRKVGVEQLFTPIELFVRACFNFISGTILVDEADCSANTSALQLLRIQLLIQLLYFIRNCLEYYSVEEVLTQRAVCNNMIRLSVWTKELYSVLLYVLFDISVVETADINALQQLPIFPDYVTNELLNSYFPHAVRTSWKYLLLLDSELAGPESFVTKLVTHYEKLCAKLIATTVYSTDSVTRFVDVSVLLFESTAQLGTISTALNGIMKRTIFATLNHLCVESEGTAETMPPVSNQCAKKIISLACRIKIPILDVSFEGLASSILETCLWHYIHRQHLAVEGFDQTIIHSLMGLSFEQIEVEICNLLKALGLLGANQSSGSRDSKAGYFNRLIYFVVDCLASLQEKLHQDVVSAPIGEMLVRIVNTVDLSFARRTSLELYYGILELEAHIPHQCRAQLISNWTADAFHMCMSNFQSVSSSVEQILRSLTVLPLILTGCCATSPRCVTFGFVDNSECVQQLVNSLEEMVASRFPLRSKELDPMSAQGKDFFVIFEAYLDSVSASGSPALLTPLLPTLREGPSHRYFGLMVKAFARLVSQVDVFGTCEGEYKAVTLLTAACLSHAFDETQTLEVKQMLMDHICFPLLRRCSSHQLVSIMSCCSSDGGILGSSGGNITVIRQLITTIQADLLGKDSEAANALAFLQSCAYTIIEIIHDRCSTVSLKNDIIKAFSGQVNPTTQKELTQTVCRLAHKMIRTELPSNIDSVNRQRLYCSGFSCLAIIVAKTQAEEKFFNSLVFDSKPEQSLWYHVIDNAVQYSFENKKFETICVGCPLHVQESQQGRSSQVRPLTQRGRLRARTARGAIGLLESSSVGGSQYMARVSQQLQEISSQRAASQLESADWGQPARSAQSNSPTPSNDFTMEPDGFEDAVVEGFDDQSIAIELNEVNSQPIMVSLIRIVQRMHFLFSDVWIPRADSLPKWLTVIRDLLVEGLGGATYGDASDSLRRNVRMVALRLLLNQPITSIVAPYSPSLLSNVMECCVHDLLGPKVKSLHYALRDVISVLCISWSNAVPDVANRGVCWKFLAGVFNVVFDDDPVIFKENLSSVSALLRKWITIDYEKGRNLSNLLDVNILQSLLKSELSLTGGAHAKVQSKGSEGLRRRLAGIEIVKSLIVNGVCARHLLEAFATSKSTSSKGTSGQNNPLIEAIFSCFAFPRKELIEESAGLLGCILNSLREQCDYDENATTCSMLSRELVTALLGKLGNNKGWDLVAASLRMVSQHDGLFVTRELFVKVNAWFTKMSPRAKYEYLSALCCSNLDEYMSDAVSHVYPHILPCLSDVSIVSLGRGNQMVRLPMIQINILKLLKQFWRKMELASLSNIVLSDVFLGVLNETSVVEAREEAFDLIIDICSFHETLCLTNEVIQEIYNGSMVMESDRNQIQRRLISLLLRGLCDPDSDGVDLDDDTTENYPAMNSIQGTQVERSPPPPSSSAASSLSSASMTQASQDSHVVPGRVVIRKRVYDYLVQSFGLSDNFVDRISVIVHGLYDPQLSEAWINYSAHLLLSLTTKSRQFSAVLFERSLANSINYVPMNLNSLTQSQNTSRGSQHTNRLIPLFSLARKSNSQLLSQADQGVLYGAFLSQSQGLSNVSQVRMGLRGTQEFSWTQTQDTSNVSLSTKNGIYASSAGKPAPLFATQSVVSFGKAGKTGSSSLGTSMSINASSNDSQSTTTSRGRMAVFTQQVVAKRFHHPSGLNKTSYAHYKHDIMKMKANQSRPSKKLAVYRKYRDGELPDISISLSDIVKPLQILSLRDTALAGNLMSLLLEYVCQSPDVIGAATTSIETLFSQFSGQLQLIMKSGVKNSQQVSLILSSMLFLIRNQVVIAPDTPRFQVEPTLIAEAAMKSLNTYGAIRLLEEQLLVEIASEDEALPKSGRNPKAIASQSQNMDESCTFSVAKPNIKLPSLYQLSRLYNQLGENEIFLNLFCQLSCKIDSHKAVEAELDGDYSRAVQLYSDLYEKNLTSGKSRDNQTMSVDRPERYDAMLDSLLDLESVETEMWTDRAIECLKQLCDWSGLNTFLDKYVITEGGRTVNFDKFTSDYRARDTYLSPYLSCLCMQEDASHTNKIFSMHQEILLFSKEGLNNLSEDDVEPPNDGRRDGSIAVSSKKKQMLDLRNWVESKHAIELASVYANKREWGKSRFFVNSAYSQLLSDWSGLQDCAIQAKRNILRSIQRIVELEDIALDNVVASGTAVSSSKPLSQSLSQPHPYTKRRLVDDNTSRDDRIVVSLLNNWSNSVPLPTDPLLYWDAVINQRYFLRRHTDVSRSIDKLVCVHLADLHRSASIAAIHQDNLFAAKTHLEKSAKMKKLVFGKAESLSLTDVMAVCNYNQKSIARKLKLMGHSQMDEINSNFERTLKLIDNKLTHSNASDSSADETVLALLLKGSWLDNFVKYKIQSHQADDCKDLLLQSTQQYETAIRISDSRMITISQTTSGLQSDIFGKAAEHFHYLLSLLEEGQFENDADSSRSVSKRARNDLPKTKKCEESNNGTFDLAKMAKQVIISHLKGLQFGSKFCQSRLLRLLKLAGKYLHVVNELEQEQPLAGIISRIPACTILAFAPQLLGCLDLPEGPVATIFLEHIAQSFPSALTYPFKITSEFLGTQGRRLSQRLSFLLRNESIDCFVEALMGISHPELRWADGVKAMNSIYKGLMSEQPQARSSAKNYQNVEINKKLQTYYLQLKQITIDCDWKFVGAKVGLYNKKWSKKAQPIADQAVGPNGENLLSLGKQALDLLVEKMKVMTDHSKMRFSSGMAPLSEFSSWLSELDHTVHAIEIPTASVLASVSDNLSPTNQFGKRLVGSLGIINSTEIILSVDPNLLVMSSIRKPKRIKLYSSFGKEYLFLVKGGEDLRNDERIQKMFTLMNSVVNSAANEFDFSAESVTSVSKRRRTGLNQQQLPNDSKGFYARTYEVIPMTSKVGLLEWVSGTVPLKSVIGKQMAKDLNFVSRNQKALASSGDAIDVASITAATLRYKWVGSHDVNDYHKMFKTKSKAQALQLYQAMMAELPDHYLRSYLLSLCSTAEAYLALRSEFIRTLSSSSLFGYILGIGDRHLDNVLFDSLTGSIVQIDFGICFGMGTSLLPVPELLPFRLSPQLLAVLKPLDGARLIKQYMSHCLRRIRHGDGKETIANALDIYLNDPVVEWMKYPLMQKDEMLEITSSALDDSNGNAVNAWEPVRRIQNAMKKINGYHPGGILLDDLSTNAKVKQEKSFDVLANIIHDVCKAGSAASIDSGVVSEAENSASRMPVVEVEDTSKDTKKRRKVSQNSTATSADLFSSSVDASSNSQVGNATKDSKSSQSAAIVPGAHISSLLQSLPPLEPGDQVDLLLALATDPQLVVRQWTGLAPWV